MSMKDVDFKDPYTWGVGVVVLIIVLFIAGVVGGVMKIEAAKNNIYDNCIKTDLVVLGGRNGTPRYVYDCSDEAKAAKR